MFGGSSKKTPIEHWLALCSIFSLDADFTNPTSCIPVKKKQKTKQKKKTKKRTQMTTIIDHYRPAQKRVWILEARSEKVCGNDNFKSEKGLRFREPEATHPHHKNSQECPFHLFISLFLSHSHFTKRKRYKRRSLKYKLL